MVVVGIDLGTSNIRISTWDPDRPDLPQPLPIGQGGTSYVMPAVVSLHRQRGGAVDIQVGEDADNADNPAGDPNVQVIRNIKRYALEHDSYVKNYLESYLEEWPTWWNRQDRSVELWGQSFPVKDLLSRLLAEAFRRAGLKEGFDWRAGCPVHAGFDYRSELHEAIVGLGGQTPGGVIEEPILYLTLAHEMGVLTPGSYLVYDVGGGSFDCAVAQVTTAGPNSRMTVFGADGNPALGGANIDATLRQKLKYTGAEVFLRVAKEAALSTGIAQPLPGGGSDLGPQDVAEAIRRDLFRSKTLTAIRLALLGSKFIWNRGEGSTPMGEILRRTSRNQVTFLEDLTYRELGEGLTGILLCGGPTKSPLFYENLSETFGDIPIVSSSDLIAPLPDPELTAISSGACYAYRSRHTPLYVNRLPARISLRDLQTRKSLTYEPYTHLAPPPKKLFSPYLSPESLVQGDGEPHRENRYELTVTTLDNQKAERSFADSAINSRLIGSEIRLRVDRLGRVGVQQKGGALRPQNHVLIDSPPWQTPEQRDALARMLEEEERYRREQSDDFNRWLESNPFGWQEHAG